MNLNIFSPTKAVDETLTNPKLEIAIALVLISSILSIVFSMYIVFTIDVISMFYVILKGFIYLFTTAVLVYVVSYFLKGKEVPKFKAIVSVVSILWIFIIILTVIGFCMMFVVPKDVVSTLAFLESRGASLGEIAESTVLQNFQLTDAMIGLLFAGLFLTLVVLIWGWYFFYRIVKSVTGKSAVISVILSLILLLVIGVLPLP